MEYVYGAMLLHAAGKDISEEALEKLLTAAGVKVDKTRVKALTASLERVDPLGPNDDTNWMPSEDYANPTSDDGGNAVCWGTPGAENSLVD